VPQLAGSGIAGEVQFRPEVFGVVRREVPAEQRRAGLENVSHVGVRKLACAFPDLLAVESIAQLVKAPVKAAASYRTPKRP
jgi:hypothetical protein